MRLTQTTVLMFVAVKERVILTLDALEVYGTENKIYMALAIQIIIVGSSHCFNLLMGFDDYNNIY